MICISFASNGYYEQQDNWEKSCRTAGFVDIIKYRETDCEKNNYGKKGYGFWFWKPYLILKTLLTNEQVIYTDTDYTIMNKHAIESIVKENQISLFNYNFKNRIWTKRDCFFYMGCDSEKYWNTLHLEAGISFWNKTDLAVQLLNEWIEYTKDRRILSDDSNVCGLPNLPEFKDCRHDQSILTNLKEKYMIQTQPITVLQGIISGSDI